LHSRLIDLVLNGVDRPGKRRNVTR
jgi:hypothetical protein